MSDLFASETFVTLNDRPDIVAGHQVIPFVDDSSMPWITILEQREPTGGPRRAVGPDAVRVPVPRASEPARKRVRSLLRRRTVARSR